MIVADEDMAIHTGRQTCQRKRTSTLVVRVFPTTGAEEGNTGPPTHPALYIPVPCHVARSTTRPCSSSPFRASPHHHPRSLHHGSYAPFPPSSSTDQAARAPPFPTPPFALHSIGAAAAVEKGHSPSHASSAFQRPSQSRLSKRSNTQFLNPGFAPSSTSTSPPITRRQLHQMQL